MNFQLIHFVSGFFFGGGQLPPSQDPFEGGRSPFPSALCTPLFFIGRIRNVHFYYPLLLIQLISDKLCVFAKMMKNESEVGGNDFAPPPPNTKLILFVGEGDFARLKVWLQFGQIIYPIVMRTLFA